MSKKMNTQKCPVPNCDRNVVPARSPHGLCTKHEEWLEFLLFILPKLTRNAPKDKDSNLVLPGDKDFSVLG